MAIITRKQEVCDVCKDEDRDAFRYRVGKMGEVRTVALCDEHAQPIADLIARLGLIVPRVAPTSKVKSLDEIEKIKKARAGARNGNGKRKA